MNKKKKNNDLLTVLIIIAVVYIIYSMFNGAKSFTSTIRHVLDNRDETIGELIDLADFSIEGDYLVGTLPHLSVWALSASNSTNVDNPSTGDDINKWVGMLLISTLGLTIGTVSAIKIKKSKIK